ncbi:hypothetical protein BDN72DRAFT_843083 [Pluteus cervinus]|uniref:Uncharacterized protein n=1 Tax=Pluteus cervinus TaxID=181527 RepID=A0ACD3AN89_9AGAR|nr:hypothetical protein BDN72DRAFT_843083 [Pluteus cervinus]
MSTLSIVRVLPAGRFRSSSFLIPPTRHRLLSSAVLERTPIQRSAYDEGGPCACTHCEPSPPGLHSSTSLKSAGTTATESSKVLEGSNATTTGLLSLWSSPNNSVLVKLDLSPTPSTPQSRSEAPNIPTVPRIVGWPTPWLTEQEHNQYLVPLLQFGWNVGYVSRRVDLPKVKEIEGATEAVLSADSTFGLFKPNSTKKPQTTFRVSTCHLTSRFAFSTYNGAVKFLNGLVELANKERHHPNISLLNNTPPEILVRIQTDSAIRPLWTGESGDKLLTPTRKIPGITRRDVRLASLAEKLYFDGYLSQGLGVQRGVNHDASITSSSSSSSSPPLPITWEEYTTKLLPKPAQPKPRSALPLIATTQKPKQRRRPTRFICKICKGNHMTTLCKKASPKKPCPNCGGKHWLVDCTIPRTNASASMVAHPTVISPPLRFDIPPPSL